MAVEIDLGPVRDEWESEYLMLAYDDIHAIEYFNQPLDAYWKRNGLTFHDMLLQSAAQYEVVMRQCESFNRELMTESLAAGGEKYRDILALTYRQAVAAHKLVADEAGHVLFSRRISATDASLRSMSVIRRFHCS